MAWFPIWWPKIRHSGMSVPMLMAYNALRIRRVLRTVSGCEGKMRRLELAAHIREVGNALMELGYAGKRTAISALGGDRLLFDSICEARHDLAHDEYSVPENRLAGFFRCAGKLAEMTDAILRLPDVASQIDLAENYLVDDTDFEVDVEFSLSRDSLPVRIFGDMDYIALCYTVMLKDIEWKDEDRAQCGADFITRADMIFALCPDATSIHYPHSKSGNLRRVLLSDMPQARKAEAADDFLRKGAANAIHFMRELVAAKGAAPLVRELSDWLERNRLKLRKLRGEFYREWLASGGELRKPCDDPELSGIFRDDHFRRHPKNRMRP